MQPLDRAGERLATRPSVSVRRVLGDNATVGSRPEADSLRASLRNTIKNHSQDNYFQPYRKQTAAGRLRGVNLVNLFQKFARRVGEITSSRRGATPRLSPSYPRPYPRSLTRCNKKENDNHGRSTSAAH